MSLEVDITLGQGAKQNWQQKLLNRFESFGYSKVFDDLERGAKGYTQVGETYDFRSPPPCLKFR